MVHSWRYVHDDVYGDLSLAVCRLTLHPWQLAPMVQNTVLTDRSRNHPGVRSLIGIRSMSMTARPRRRSTRSLAVTLRRSISRSRSDLSLCGVDVSIQQQGLAEAYPYLLYPSWLHDESSQKQSTRTLAATRRRSISRSRSDLSLLAELTCRLSADPHSTNESSLDRRVFTQPTSPHSIEESSLDRSLRVVSIRFKLSMKTSPNPTDESSSRLFTSLLTVLGSNNHQSLRAHFLCCAKSRVSLASLGRVLSDYFLLPISLLDSSGGASGGDDEQQEDALQATIDKSKKVLDMLRNLLHQIAERRKLVSSIKDTTPNLDHAKEDYGSSSSVSAIKKEENGNASVSPSNYGKSFLNKLPEANKTSPLERSKQSSASVQSSSPSGVASSGKPWSSVVASSVDPPYKPSSKQTSDPVTLVLVRFGGLGDVAGALPKALARLGHRVMVVVPRYAEYEEAKDVGVRKRYEVAGQDMEVMYFHGVDFVFIDSPVFRHLSNNIYGGNRLDILKRMVLFCKAAVEVPCVDVCYGDGNLAFIANDWHTALLPVYLKAYYRDHGLMKYTRSLLVIHNIAHQGRGPVHDFSYVDLPGHYLDSFKLGENSNGLEMLLEGGWSLHNIISENDWKFRGIVKSFKIYRTSIEEFSINFSTNIKI
ncbi:hypothetical protein IGI04_004224 [Brassica rapa subsp. trilocularis]|uniref:Starch synthase catalytic domain-containing protein n=1 Tax=Brassica rapa subsp. trilocularis TaxID=1813537 RepID=A0ABQ7P0N7_BRACM|nr:hypothetical protein IGI04_004224 [Brassica rapa subsp. trilocularis]